MHLNRFFQTAFAPPLQVVKEALVLPLVESVIADEQEGRAPGAAPASDQLAPVCLHYPHTVAAGMHSRAACLAYIGKNVH